MSQTPNNDGMSLIVKTISGWLKGFILLYGIYIILYGHLTPGGGFAGGVIAASAFVMIMLAEGKQDDLSSLSCKSAATRETAGALLFLAMALAGLVMTGTFFVNLWTTPESARFTLLSSGIIPVCNIGIGLKVCSSLFLVFMALSAVYVAVTRRTKGEAT